MSEFRKFLAWWWSDWFGRLIVVSWVAMMAAAITWLLVFAWVLCHV